MEKEACKYCFELINNCICQWYTCSVCKKRISNWDSETGIMEYRGAYSCGNCHEKMIENRDYERQQIIEEEHHKTKVFVGLDMNPDSPLGKANRHILRREIEVAKKESGRIKIYENR